MEYIVCVSWDYKGLEFSKMHKNLEAKAMTLGEIQGHKSHSIKTIERKIRAFQQGSMVESKTSHISIKDDTLTPLWQNKVQDFETRDRLH